MMSDDGGRNTMKVIGGKRRSSRVLGAWLGGGDTGRDARAPYYFARGWALL